MGPWEYDADNKDWACGEDFAPGEKYFPVTFIHTKKWEELLLDAVTLASRFIQSPEFSRSFLATATAITVGFDDGELQRVK
jgi:hypothetical protein